MKSYRFYLSVTLRVLFIVGNCYLLVYFINKTGRPVSVLYSTLLLVFQIIWLISFLTRVHRDLANFLVSFHDDDTSLGFSKKNMERYFKDVLVNLDRITAKIQAAQIAREQQHQYLKAVIEHTGVGFISYTSEGKIELINQAAKLLFGFNNPANIDTLTSKYPELRGILSGESVNNRQLVRIKKDSKEIQLAVKTSHLRINDSLFTLASFQDIRYELESQELESWKKLIRVLRHEIMNSITPIITLTSAIRRCFTLTGNRKNPAEVSETNIEDALESAIVIEDRSRGLISFVEKFKNLTNLPEPHLQRLSPVSLFREVEALFHSDLEKLRVQMELEVNPSGLSLQADKDLLEQVLINLVKNALEAIDHDKGMIRLFAEKQANGEVQIHIADNGSGILNEYLDSVFIPSFTTKKSGSGIGLSISRQIMQMHKGSIQISSIPGQTCVTLIFPS
jgi:two-component system, NtrC family, nitrogen regulation sensor histidine kinase NtrY